MTFNEQLRQQDIANEQKAYQRQNKNIHINRWLDNVDTNSNKRRFDLFLQVSH